MVLCGGGSKYRYVRINISSEERMTGRSPDVSGDGISDQMLISLCTFWMCNIIIRWERIRITVEEVCGGSTSRRS